MNEQPEELRDYLSEGEAIVREWYSRGNLEETHQRNLDFVATLFCLNVVMEQDVPFAVVRDMAMMYLVTAFQMGRASDNDSRAGK